MNWKTVRLELARSLDFPKGSPGRSYLLRLPLDESGRIDEPALRREPAQATVRRYWPNEPDLSGRVVPARDGWSLSYEPPAPARGATLSGRLPHRPIELGACIDVTEPDGRSLAFRVASLAALA